MALCLYIYNKRVSMPLPVPNTEHVLPFTNLVGSEHVESSKEVSGCYFIKGPNMGRSSVTGIENVESYLGQTKHLGRRVKFHAKEQDPSTKSLVEPFKEKCTVELFILSDDIPEGLSKLQFLSLLEQYLIIKLKPTLNKKINSYSRHNVITWS